MPWKKSRESVFLVRSALSMMFFSWVLRSLSWFLVSSTATSTLGT